MQQTPLGNFTHVEITKFGVSILRQKNVCTLQVPVKNFTRVQRVDTEHEGDENTPDLILFEKRFIFLMCTDLVIQVSIISIVHHNAKKLILVNKGVLITDDIGVSER